MFFDNNRCIMTAKAECITQGVIDIPFLRFVEREVEGRVEAFVVGEVINCRWDNAVPDGHQTGYYFDRAGSPEEVSSHRLGRADVELAGMLPENVLNGF